MQCIKRSSTLRFGKKRGKPRPRIVHRHEHEDKRIGVYLGSRALAKKCERALAVRSSWATKKREKVSSQSRAK